MKTSLLATTLFVVTTASIALYPELNAKVMPPVTVPPIANTQPMIPPQNAVEIPNIEVVFVLDTTGSMSGMIEAAKEKIWSIASTMATADPAPNIKIGLVAYRDRGDAYVTLTTDLTDDLDSVYAKLMQLQAQGGGDTPESVNQALHEAVQDISWSSQQNSYQVIFLVGDAPPHMDYQNDVRYQDSIAQAKSKGILVNTIQCGNDASTKQNWQSMASLGGGDYFTVAQNGGAIAVTTPYDSKIAMIAKKIEDTRIFYGTEEKRASLKNKERLSDELYEKASPSALARRAEFNSSASGAKNLLGESELVDDVATGKVDVKELDQSLLPDELRALAPAVQQTLISEKSEQRQRLQKALSDLTKERRDYVENEVAGTAASEASLDYQVFETIQKQAKTKGLEYKDSDLRL
ncbi:MAG: VWA domain-containing protein [Hahellaceae bacterium]|nr:VWA domain-containing protein [Hahellaceae bacterium]MCP5212764.1 VWA domain-containing protein [Hahellaceae bacterium]